MDIRYQQVKNGEQENYLLPFLWLVGGEPEEELRATVARIYQTGARAFCIEPRGFRDFEKEWWEKLDVLFDEAQKRAMKVWVVDETQLPPTGHVYGLVSTKYPERRKLHLVEAHVDVMGPCKDACLVLGKTGVFLHTQEQDELLCAYAYKRLGAGDEIDVKNPIPLTQNVKGNLLIWDIPEGAYRIMYVFKTRKYVEVTKDCFIDFINKESVDLLLEYVYEDYKRRYGHLFGNTLVGFFSDEPSIDNNYSFVRYDVPRYSEVKLGKIGLTLAWTDELKALMEEKLGYALDPYLPALWYDCGGLEKEIRFTYMDALSHLYRVNFTERVGAWCRLNGLQYIGHVIEDNGLHCRFGHGAGHYFRAESGQDMPGIDIVMHQVLPGFADYNCTGSGVNGHSMDHEFFHYLLGKLNSSAAHTYPQYDGKALCEVMIAYGWAEGTRLAKWLVDFLLVRGTNHFVTHAFRPKDLDEVHAPHFGSTSGNEPQFKGICKLLNYTNQASHLLQGKHVASVGILYHAFSEWYNTNGYMTTEKVAKRLYDGHLDYDVVAEDVLDSLRAEDGKLKILQAEYDYLIVPYAPELPKQLTEQLQALEKRGGKILFVNGVPSGYGEGTVVPLDGLLEWLRTAGVGEVSVENAPLLRHYHAKRDGNDVFMFFNEDVGKTFDGEISLNVRGKCVVADLLNDDAYETECDGKLHLTLTPYQSVLVIFNADGAERKTPLLQGLQAKEFKGEYTVSLASYEDMHTFTFFEKTCELKAVSAADRLPAFSGAIRYETKFTLDKAGRTLLAFENVGENAEVFVNGKACGMRICPPYRYEITDAVHVGENTLEVVVYTTLANAVQDNVSMFVPLTPTGITGKVVLYTE
ncbi:MAG: hypothetical protein IJX81_03990 [Clostridia bacterium]|nr:hypothetical protein [Clostridia bacterium]